MPAVEGTDIYSAAEIAWLAWKVIPPALTFASDDEKEKWVMVATAVALAESKGNARAHNPIGQDDSYGLWQINMKGQMGQDRLKEFGISKKEDLFSGITNARAMMVIWTGNGWRPWSVFTSGIYLVHIPVAMRAAKAPKQPSNVAGGEDQTETIVGGKIIDAIFDPLIGFIKEAGLRVGGFVGGAALLIGAIVLVSKKGVK